MEIDTLLGEYLPVCETAVLPSIWPEMPAVCRDRDDAVFIALLLSADTDFLVSGDADLAVLRGAVRVISVAEVRAMLDSGE